MQKFAIALSVAVIVVSVVLWVLWQFYADHLIEAAFNGQSLSLVNKYVAIHRSIDPAQRTLGYFVENGKPVVPRLLGLLIASQTPSSRRRAGR